MMGLMMLGMVNDGLIKCLSCLMMLGMDNDKQVDQMVQKLVNNGQ